MSARLALVAFAEGRSPDAEIEVTGRAGLELLFKGCSADPQSADSAEPDKKKKIKRKKGGKVIEDEDDFDAVADDDEDEDEDAKKGFYAEAVSLSKASADDDDDDDDDDEDRGKKHGGLKGKDQYESDDDARKALAANFDLLKGLSKPPAGFAAIPGGKKGGYRKRQGKGYVYWYPGDGHSGRDGPHGSDVQVVATEHLSDEERELISRYKMQVVGDDADAAVEIARKVMAGIEKAGEICETNPPVCEGNLGIPRDDMPQILDDPLPEMKDGKDHWKYEAAVAAGANPNETKPPLQQMMEALKAKGVAITEGKIPVGRLMATQAEIRGAKALGMAHAQLTGEFRGEPVDLTKKPIVVTKPDADGNSHILDGHHRFAAMLMIGPEREMNTIQIDMSMPELLDFAMDLPGVFRANADDEVIVGEKPDFEAYARKARGEGGEKAESKPEKAEKAIVFSDLIRKARKHDGNCEEAHPGVEHDAWAAEDEEGDAAE